MVSAAEHHVSRHVSWGFGCVKTVVSEWAGCAAHSQHQYCPQYLEIILQLSLWLLTFTWFSSSSPFQVTQIPVHWTPHKCPVRSGEVILKIVHWSWSDFLSVGFYNCISRLYTNVLCSPFSLHFNFTRWRSKISWVILILGVHVETPDVQIPGESEGVHGAECFMVPVQSE